MAFGAIVLAVTGAEALYADMGHFGRKPIRLAWLGLVLPGLVLNYFGQGALILRDPDGGAAARSSSWCRRTGALAAGRAGDAGHGHRLAGGDLRRVLADPPGDPARLPAAHGDPAHLGDRDRPDLHPARELAADGRRPRRWWWASARRTTWPPPTASPSPAPCWSMPRSPWRWRSWCGAGSGRSPSLVFGLLAMPDLAFFVANALKIPDGGWLPLLVAALVFFTITTWRRGRRAGRRRAQPKARCRCASSSSAWSARPTASPARRCS